MLYAPGPGVVSPRSYFTGQMNVEIFLDGRSTLLMMCLDSILLMLLFVISIYSNPPLFNRWIMALLNSQATPMARGLHYIKKGVCSSCIHLLIKFYTDQTSECKKKVRSDDVLNNLSIKSTHLKKCGCKSSTQDRISARNLHSHAK